MKLFKNWDWETRSYNHLFRSVLCGIVQYRLDSMGEVVFKNANPEAIRIFGYEPEEFWAKKDWRLPELIDEADRERVLEGAKSLQKVGQKQGYEYRLRQKDGSPLWIIGSAELIRDLDGEVVVQSVFLDIDNSKKAEMQNQRLTKQVEAGNELLKMALEHTDNYEFYYYPEERRVIIPERTTARFHCKSCYEDMPQSFAEDFVAEACWSAFTAMYDAIHRGERTATAEFSSKNAGAWCRVTLSSVGYGEKGEPVFVVGIVEDITKEKKMAAALEAAHTRDPLTGLYNKEPGVAMVRQHMLQKPVEEPCVLMLLDMDNFKAVNTAEGSVFADAILQDVADILCAESGPEDYQIRLGGDEFMLFLKNCDRPQAVELGPRIAERVKSLYGGREPHLSVSIGMCATSVVNEYNGLYRCAESTLMYVKEHGKGGAACYLDTSNEAGADLTRIYYDEGHVFNDIDNKGSFGAENMMDFALEVLGRGKKLDDAIFLVLARMGTRLKLDRVSIVEFDRDYLSFRYAYQWSRSRADLQMGQEFYIDRELYERLPHLYGEEGIYERAFNRKSAMASCLQAAFWNQGMYAGALGFEIRDPDYVWTDEERKLLKEMTKLISSFIMKAKADAVSRAKTDFLSRMSHEIRTPMNAISGMTIIAKSLVDDREKVLDCLDKIEASNAYLLTLINDILDMSRIESGKVELNPRAVDLAAELRRLHAMLLPQAKQKGIEFTVENHLEARPLMLDALRLNQVLINVVGNAIKFTERGSVKVRVEPVGHRASGPFVRFSVEDTGVGILKENQSRIFNAFEQGRREVVEKYGGTGLGLSISSRLVQMMGGTLKVESEAGRGSKFSFTLALPYGEGEAEPEMPKAMKPMDFTGKRLLLVEDNALNRDIAKTILEMQGFVVETARDGQEGVDAYAAHEPGYYACILMDIRMPVMDGLEATRRIRTLGREDSRTVPIIAMTANAFDEDSHKSMESGMNGHLTKPVVIEELFGLLGQCLA